MKTPCSGSRRGSARRDRPRSCRADDRTHCDALPGRACRNTASPSASRSASRIMPAHVPSIGAPARARAGIGSRRPYGRSAGASSVDSPPGRISASRPTRSRGRRTSTGSAPISRIALDVLAHCALRRRAPRSGQVAAGPCRRPYQPRMASRSSARDLAERAAAHRLSEARAHLGEDLGVVVVGRGLDDRAASALGLLALKMPDPTKTASAPSWRMSAASAGVATPPALKFGTGSAPSSAVCLTTS